MKERKIQCIQKNVNVSDIYVSLANIKCYKKVTYDDNEYESGKDKYKVDFVGNFEFVLDVETGRIVCASGIKNRLVRVGSSFFKEHFREQVPIINRECKKGFKSVIKQLKTIKFR